MHRFSIYELMLSLFSAWYQHPSAFTMSLAFNRSFAVCLCVVFCEHSLSVSLAAVAPGTSADHREPFWTVRGLKLWGTWLTCCVIISGVITHRGSSGIRAAYDFMETSYDNGRLVCIVLNRSGEWMTTTSASGEAQKLCGKGNGLFMKRRSLDWGQMRIVLIRPFFRCRHFFQLTYVFIDREVVKFSRSLLSYNSPPRWQETKSNIQ